MLIAVTLGSLVSLFNAILLGPAVRAGAAPQACLTLKALSGMALRRMKGFVKNLLRLVGFDRKMPAFSMISTRQNILAVYSP